MELKYFITINQRRTSTNESFSNILLDLSYSQSLWSGRTEPQNLGEIFQSPLEKYHRFYIFIYHYFTVLLGYIIPLIS